MDRSAVAFFTWKRESRGKARTSAWPRRDSLSITLRVLGKEKVVTVLESSMLLVLKVGIQPVVQRNVTGS